MDSPENLSRLRRRELPSGVQALERGRQLCIPTCWMSRRILCELELSGELQHAPKRFKYGKEKPMKYFHAAIALILLASTGAASAQTTVITREPADTQTVVTTERLQLTPMQRQTIYRTIVQEPLVEAPPPTVEYRVGMRLPPSTRLYAVPQSVVTEVPAVRTYKYMVVNHHVVLVDPTTSEVVADLAD